MISKFAMIANGEVYNIEVYETREDAVKMAQILKGSDATAVNIDYIGAAIGMKYHDDWFYSVDENGNETAAERILTEAQKISELENQNAQLITVLADLIGGATNE